MWYLLFLLFVPREGEASPDDPIEIVKAGYLEIHSRKTVGMAFEGYRWFDGPVTWTVRDGLVIASGEADDAIATKRFEELHKYHYKMAFKATQLQPTYDLRKDKDRLRFTVRFELNGEGGFTVHSGCFAVRQGEPKMWLEHELDNKPLVAMLRGIFRNEDPYTALVNGLPFK